ncbi:MAG: hypothetical protein ACYTXT_01305 [Nostoc sp.]
MMALQVIALQKTSKTKRSPVCKSECDVYDGLRLRITENLTNHAIGSCGRVSAITCCGKICDRTCKSQKVIADSMIAL